MKRIIVVCWLVMLLTGVLTLFWYNEWMYQLPTPIPQNYAMVNVGQTIQIPFAAKQKADRPVFLHFFNPDCPCSRFNVPHFKVLVKKYSSKIDFWIVPVSTAAKMYSTKEIQDKIGLNLPILFDSTLAHSCGVYSTPQAVILDADYRLYFRGNYNRSRYCADTQTEYARLALDSFLNDPTATPIVDQLALKAYGCQITLCKSK